MKKIVTAITVGLCASLLTGCSETNNGGIIDFSDLIRPKTEIRVWIDDEQGDYVAELIKEFNKIEPDILVTHQHMGTADAREKLKTFGPSGNGADVWQLPHDNLAPAISEDLVLALSSDVKNRLEETLHETAMDIGCMYYNGGDDFTQQPGQETKLFGVPQSIESIVLMYNAALVDTPVTTFEQLVTEANAYQSSTGKPYLGQSSHWADSYMVQFAYSAFGFYPFGPELNDASEVGFDSVEAQNALTWMRDVLKPITTGDGTADSQNSGASFESGELPYIISGPWMIESYKEKLGNDLKVTTIPSINGNDAKPFTGAIMNSVYKYSKEPEAATKFVEFMSSEVGMDLMYKYKGKLPALKSELLSDEVKADEILQIVSKQIEMAVPMPTIPSTSSYWGPGEAMIKSIWNSNADIVAALKEAEVSYKAAEALRKGQ